MRHVGYFRVLGDMDADALHVRNGLRVGERVQCVGLEVGGEDVGKTLRALTDRLNDLTHHLHALHALPQRMHAVQAQLDSLLLAAARPPPPETAEADAARALDSLRAAAEPDEEPSDAATADGADASGDDASAGGDTDAPPASVDPAPPTPPPLVRARSEKKRATPAAPRKKRAPVAATSD